MINDRLPTAALVAVTATAAAFIAIGANPHAPTPSPAPPAADVPNDTATSVQPAAASRAPSKPIVATASGGSLTLATELSHNVVSTEQRTMWLRVKLDAAKVEGGERPPLDVALVIDRSGSMRGPKLQQAKAAASELVARLGPEDRMSVSSFSSYAHVEAALTDAEANAVSLNEAVRALYPGGGTSIYDGYQTGLRTLTEANRAASRVVFLLSDGLGPRSPEELGRATAAGLSQHDTSITTLGIGDNFDEQTLGAMAVRGGGKFYYVETPGALREHLNEEWEGLASAAARNVRLRLKPQRGVEIRNVVGFETTNVGGATSVRLDSVYSERSRQIIVELGVEAEQVDDALLDVAVEYDDVTAKPATGVTTSTRVKAPRIDRVLTAADENEDVLSRVRRVQTARAVDEADKLLVDGKRDEAELLLQQVRERNDAFIARHRATEELDSANEQLQRSRQELTRPIREKRQIRSRKKRKQATIEIIAGDRK